MIPVGVIRSLSHSSKVLECIRLPLISPYYLHDVIESLDVVKENQACQKLISEAKDYMLLKDRRGELYFPGVRLRRSRGVYKLIPCVFIMGRGCISVHL